MLTRCLLFLLLMSQRDLWQGWKPKQQAFIGRLLVPQNGDKYSGGFRAEPHPRPLVYVCICGWETEQDRSPLWWWSVVYHRMSRGERYLGFSEETVWGWSLGNQTRWAICCRLGIDSETLNSVRILQGFSLNLGHWQLHKIKTWDLRKGDP